MVLVDDDHIEESNPESRHGLDAERRRRARAKVAVARRNSLKGSSSSKVVKRSRPSASMHKC